ncbi:MAG TPA: hypothetical protein VF097_05355 [Actinomycetota bacterium]
MTERARDALRRELYWGDEPRAAGPTRELRARIERLADSLQADLARPFPADPSFSGGSRWRLGVKRFLYRLNRPLTRRQDRIAAELAAISLELLDHLGRLEDELRRVEERSPPGDAS